MSNNYPTRIDLCDGKYTVIYDFGTGQSEALHYGKPWRPLRGDKMVLAMFDEIVEQRREVAAYRRGNTALLEALMDMVNQYFIHLSDGDVLTHSFMSCEEGAIAVLIEAGFAEDVDKGYVLLWDKLNERMKNYDQ